MNKTEFLNPFPNAEDPFDGRRRKTGPLDAKIHQTQSIESSKGVWTDPSEVVSTGTIKTLFVKD